MIRIGLCTGLFACLPCFPYEMNDDDNKGNKYTKKR